MGGGALTKGGSALIPKGLATVLRPSSESLNAATGDGATGGGAALEAKSTRSGTSGAPRAEPSHRHPGLSSCCCCWGRHCDTRLPPASQAPMVAAGQAAGRASFGTTPNQTAPSLCRASNFRHAPPAAASDRHPPLQGASVAHPSKPAPAQSSQRHLSRPLPRAAAERAGALPRQRKAPFAPFTPPS